MRLLTHHSAHPIGVSAGVPTPLTLRRAQSRARGRSWGWRGRSGPRLVRDRNHEPHNIALGIALIELRDRVRDVEDPRLRGVTDGARTRDLRSHNPMSSVTVRPGVSGNTAYLWGFRRF